MHPGPNHPARQRRTSWPPAQPQYLTFDRAHREARPQGGCVDSVGDHDGVRAVVGVIKSPDRTSPLHAEILTAALKSVDQFPVVHREFVDGDETVSNALGEQWLDITSRAGECDRMSLSREPVGDGAQIGGIGTVDRDHQ